ncbi:MAG: ABC transporter ATP-binding protein [Phycisphaerae bacterium]|nr:ABC transporter ATP-binding protein [Phycisphaerae bacterium]
MATIIKAEKLSKLYKLAAEIIHAVDGIDFEIQSGEFLAVMGPSGSGKTTLLDIIGCLDSISGGRLEILGKDVSRLPERKLVNIRRGRIGFVFQDFSLIPTLTAMENVRYGGWLAGRNTSPDKAMSYLDKVGLAGRAAHLPRQLSGGEKQRVAIARALAVEPEILIADEPTGHLDSVNSQAIVDLLIKLNAKDGLTVILATHDIGLGNQCSRIISLRDGKIVA